MYIYMHTFTFSSLIYELIYELNLSPCVCVCVSVCVVSGLRWRTLLGQLCRLPGAPWIGRHTAICGTELLVINYDVSTRTISLFTHLPPLPPLPPPTLSTNVVCRQLFGLGRHVH